MGIILAEPANTISPVDRMDEPSARCVNPHCKMFGIRQYTRGRTACRAKDCNTPFEQVSSTPTTLQKPTTQFTECLATAIRLPSKHAKAAGVRLRQIRRRKHLSQRQLAKTMNVPRTYISKVETGNCIPNINTYRRLAKHLEMAAEDLIREVWAPFVDDPSLFPEDTFSAEMIFCYCSMDKRKREFLRWATAPNGTSQPSLVQLQEKLQACSS